VFNLIYKCLTGHYFLTTHPNNHLSAPMASTCHGRSFSYASAFSPKPTNTETSRFVVVVHLSHRLSHATSHRPSRATSTEGFRFSLTNFAHSTRETQPFLSNFLKGFPFFLTDFAHSILGNSTFLFKLSRLKEENL